MANVTDLKTARRNRNAKKGARKNVANPGELTFAKLVRQADELPFAKLIRDTQKLRGLFPLLSPEFQALMKRLHPAMTYLQTISRSKK